MPVPIIPFPMTAIAFHGVYLCCTIAAHSGVGCVITHGNTENYTFKHHGPAAVQLSVLLQTCHFLLSTNFKVESILLESTLNKDFLIDHAVKGIVCRTNCYPWRFRHCHLVSDRASLHSAYSFHKYYPGHRTKIENKLDFIFRR